MNAVAKVKNILQNVCYKWYFLNGILFKTLFETLKKQKGMENEKEALVKIGKKLKELRIKKGFKSYEEFAWTHDIPRSHYWKIENGKSNITMRTLVRILNIHGVSLKKFFA